MQTEATMGRRTEATKQSSAEGLDTEAPYVVAEEPVVKYYSLQSSSLNQVDSLEGNLKRELLRNKDGEDRVSIEEVVKAQDGTASADTMGKLIYDSGDFDVLYKDVEVVREEQKERKRWLKEDIPYEPGDVKINLVVKALPSDIVKLQDYLTESEIDVVEARRVNFALFEYRQGTTPDGLDTYFKRLEEIQKELSPDVKVGFTQQDIKEENTSDNDEENVEDDNVSNDIDVTSHIEISFMGPVEQVIRMREYILATEAKWNNGKHATIFISK